jgi:hypothetical protein
MKVILNEEWFEEIRAIIEKEDGDNAKYMHHYVTGRGKMRLDIADWSDESIATLHAFLGKKYEAGDRSAKLSQNVVQQWLEVKSDPAGQIVTKLENVAPALKMYIEKAPHRYVFEQTTDGNIVPWFVIHIGYEPPNARQGTPAYVSVDLKGINTLHGGNSNKEFDTHKFSIRTEDIRKRTVSQLMEAKGFFLETPARMLSYQKEVQRYLEFCDRDGFQMSVAGKCYLMRGWYDSKFRMVGQNGRPAKMVMDPPERDRGNDVIHASFWDKNEETVWLVPIHPVFEMFDLDEHADYRVHVNNAEVYIYNDTVDEKLVLPKDVKSFMTELIEHSKNSFEDIVGGKEGGVIVLIDGLPGIGKTLSAEIYAEKMHRPLYRVQSSQLGIDPETVEKQLKEVLQRSERWGAILLLDEADVYVRRRGIDIQQNAIVGVFLRVLEYYRGVLFMTSNLGLEVDDAIVSRATAQFHFEMPDENDQKVLWRVLGDQNKLGMTDAEIGQIVKALPELSGRDIKNLIKLAIIATMNKGGRVTPDVVKFVSRFKAGVVRKGRIAE